MSNRWIVDFFIGRPSLKCKYSIPSTIQYYDYCQSVSLCFLRVVAAAAAAAAAAFINATIIFSAL